MFDDLEKIRQLAESDDRTDQVADAYAGLEESPIRVSDGIVSKEDDQFIDIGSTFYLIPVIDYEESDYFEDKTQYLQLALAMPGKRAAPGETDTLDNKEFAQDSMQKSGINGTDAKDLGIDVVFVLDVSGSMQKFVDATKEAIGQIAIQIKETGAEARFGVVAYRDDAKNLTANGLVEEAEFRSIVAGLKAEGGDDSQEEMFEGVRQAIESPWGENSLRMIVRFGDFSSHPPSSSLSLTHMSAEEIRQLASDSRISIFSMYLKHPMGHPEINADRALAEAQYQKLAQNPGSQISAYFGIDFSETEFSRAVKSLTQGLSSAVGEVRGGDTSIIEETFTESSASKGVALERKARDVARAAVAAQTVVYLGGESTPPKDLTVWVIDRDLTDHSRIALDVNMLVSRTDLNDLYQALEDILKTFERSKLLSSKFLDNLQAVVAASSKGEKVDAKRAEELVMSDLMPSWIESLPYKSAILNLSPEAYDELSPDEKTQIEQGVENLLAYYSEVLEDADKWHKLDERASSDDEVFPLSLEMLP